MFTKLHLSPSLRSICDDRLRRELNKCIGGSIDSGKAVTAQLINAAVAAAERTESEDHMKRQYGREGGGAAVQNRVTMHQNRADTKKPGMSMNSISPN